MWNLEGKKKCNCWYVFQTGPWTSHKKYFCLDELYPRPPSTARRCISHILYSLHFRVYTYIFISSRNTFAKLQLRTGEQLPSDYWAGKCTGEHGCYYCSSEESNLINGGWMSCHHLLKTQLVANKCSVLCVFLRLDERTSLENHFFFCNPAWWSKMEIIRSYIFNF